MPREIKPEGLPGERYDLSDMFSTLPGSVALESSQTVEARPSSVATEEAVGDQFRRVLKWIGSINGTHSEIPLRCASEHTGPIERVEDYFSVQSIGRGKYVTHINNRLDCQLVEGDLVTIKIDKHGLGAVAFQPHVLVEKGGRAD